MNQNILTIKVGTGIQSSLALAQQMLERLEVGEEPAPYFGVGFKNVSQMLSVFTPKRWDLLAALREHGAMSIAELARTLQRDYKNVHNDVERLMEWLAIERDANGKIFTPYSEIIVDVHLPQQKAA
ncbi:transcriptional regulator [Thiothrix winogradskyi]|uniref:Transcriptional regulator n=1 Tax=Thiothrix winogradskyi TaxID=96472 RepID=A0ABY3T0C7_9GAMM|nr:transcriptional regulator [Thiothrix winogradskyi]UJS24263.1 transcriptional regulator [Thiothrix winogradskyi]